MFEAELRELGLTENEVKIYLVLLKNKVLSPYKIAEKTGLHRGSIYDTLDRMQEKGIVSSVLIKNKKHFQAIDPPSLIETYRLKLENLEKISSKLKELMFVDKEETNVQLYKGKRVYKTLLKNMIPELKTGSTIYLFGIDETILSDIEPIYLEQYFNIIKEKKVKEKIIIKKGGKKFKKRFLEYRELENKYVGNTSYIIYNNKLSIFIWGVQNYLIIIENEKVAETYKKQFELLWEKAKSIK